MGAVRPSVLAWLTVRAFNRTETVTPCGSDEPMWSGVIDGGAEMALKPVTSKTPARFRSTHSCTGHIRAVENSLGNSA